MIIFARNCRESIPVVNQALRKSWKSASSEEVSAFCLGMSYFHKFNHFCYKTAGVSLLALTPQQIALCPWKQIFLQRLLFPTQISVFVLFNPLDLESILVFAKVAKSHSQHVDPMLDKWRRAEEKAKGQRRLNRRESSKCPISMLFLWQLCFRNILKGQICEWGSYAISGTSGIEIYP